MTEYEKLSFPNGNVEISIINGIKKKSIVSILILPFLVFLLGKTNYQKDVNGIHNAFLVFMVLWSIVRVYFVSRLKVYLNSGYPKKWWKRFTQGAFINAVVWGAYSVFVVKTAGSSYVSYYLIMMNLAIAGGAVSSMYLDLKLLNSYLFFLCVPLIVASFLWMDPIIGTGLLVFFLHSLSHARVHYKMFWSGQNSKSLIATVIDSIPGPLSYVNNKLEYLGVNKYLANLLNVSIEEVLKKPIGFYERKGEFREFIREVFDSKENQLSQEINIDVGNKSIPMLLIASKFNRNKNAVVIGIDITERIKAQTELETQRALNVEAAKLASLGEMAGGIAHEINNPLAIISGKANALKKNLALLEINSDLKDKLLVDSNAIETTVFRIAKIIKGMRKIARTSDKSSYERAMLNEVIEDALSISRERITSRGFKLEVLPIPENICIECSGTQISQVILNLVSNAFDANRDTEKPWIKVTTMDLGAKVQIRVSDSGTGLPKEIREKIFQPFYTTKEVGNGMGLGLSISKGIVENHSGRLFVDDTEETTCFVLELPKTRQKKNQQTA